jgi:FKBP-type peptidyl-prolyl cis-trans isomerase
MRRNLNMKWLIVAAGFCCLAAMASAQEQIPASQKSAPAAAFDTDEQRGAYAIGLGIGENLRAQQLEDIDLASMLRGIKDGVMGAKPALDAKARVSSTQFMQKRLLERVAAKNKAEGEKFLAENAKKEGVKTTKSGLQYKILKDGKGPSPKATDLVRTHYKGTFVNGEEFDSSGPEPIEFEVNRVVPGWTEALQMMKVGSKWQLFVPYKLAYGERGDRGIPPSATLIFDVELLDIVSGTPKSK